MQSLYNSALLIPQHIYVFIVTYCFLYVVNKFTIGYRTKAETCRSYVKGRKHKKCNSALFDVT